MAIPVESFPEELQLSVEAFMITQGSGPMYQHGKHSLFVRWVVICMEIEFGVCGFTVDPMAQ
jgi:hypothetical protein